MSNNRAKIKKLCSLLSPLTQSGTVSSSRAGTITKGFLEGDETPLEELINDKTIPVKFLPIIEQIKKEVLA